MRIIHGQPGEFLVENGETITVTVSNPVNVMGSVNYSWNGAGGSLPLGTPYQHTYSPQDPAKSGLGVLVHFFNSPGGSYIITITGDRGPDSYVDRYEQEGSEPFSFQGYIFHRS